MTPTPRPTPPQANALRAMQAGERHSLYRWPGGYWCREPKHGHEALPRDYAATATVRALVARKWAMPIRPNGGSAYHIVQITDAGRDVLADCSPGTRHG